MATNLYGGHQGESFVIRNSFKSVAEAVAQCKKGSDYKQVWYGDFLLIDTPNKNDRDNGKLFKRGLNYQNDMGGLLYVGQLVGPSSGTPYFSLDTIPNTQQKGQIDLPDYWYRRYPTGKDSDGNYITTEEKGTPAIFDFDKNVEQGLVPGKYVDNGTTRYNDNIKYTWVNIRADTAEADSWYYVGMSFPYTVIDYGLHSTSPYDEHGNRLKDASEIERTDTYEHPYYEKWELGLPHGIKGDALRNLRVITPTSSDVIYSVDSMSVDDVTGEVSFGQPGYEGQQDDIAHNRQILVFDYYFFDKVRSPQPYTIYLGKWNIVSKVQVDDDGTLHIFYTHDDETRYDRKIKWVKQAALTTGNGINGGTFSIRYNNGDPDAVFHMTWIKNIQIDKENGDVTYTYVGNDGGTLPDDGIVVVPHLVKWVKDVSLDAETGHFAINFNDETSYINDLNWVKDIIINEETGEIIIKHTVSGDKVSDSHLKLLTGMSVDDTGVVTMYFNTGQSTTIKNIGTNTDFHIKVITNVSLATGIKNDKHIKVKYNTETEAKNIGDPINFIQDVVIRSNDFHLFILYSDPEHRPRVNSDGSVTYPDGTGANDWVSNTDIRGSIGINRIPDYGTDVYWRDYGSVKDDHGVLVGFNISNADTGGEDVIQYLNEKYPNGLTAESQNSQGSQMGPAVAQKVVTYSPDAENGKQDKEFYAFDYNTYKWYYLGSISDSGIRDVKLLDSGAINSTTLASLNTKGLLFKAISTEYSDNPMPSYWAVDYVQV